MAKNHTIWTRIIPVTIDKKVIGYTLEFGEPGNDRSFKESSQSRNLALRWGDRIQWKVDFPAAETMKDVGVLLRVLRSDSQLGGMKTYLPFDEIIRPQSSEDTPPQEFSPQTNDLGKIIVQYPFGTQRDNLSAWCPGTAMGNTDNNEGWFVVKRDKSVTKDGKNQKVTQPVNYEYELLLSLPENLIDASLKNDPRLTNQSYALNTDGKIRYWNFAADPEMYVDEC